MSVVEALLSTRLIDRNNEMTGIGSRKRIFSSANATYSNIYEHVHERSFLSSALVTPEPYPRYNSFFQDHSPYRYAMRTPPARGLLELDSRQLIASSPAAFCGFR